ncbi:hypothetical protein BKA64DRAFT_648308 [Cadophora sp. MPI-SDFR-AT-0126]|nr:hypothetical protein BKA64DRAFT_648308 [Leotiomycetes sp. MPI-SDFR-AT-0126]
MSQGFQETVAELELTDLARDGNARVKILEWQKLVLGKRLAIADRTGTGVETETPDLKQMLAVVSRRAGVLGQEGQAIHDLQSELDVGRVTAESYPQEAEHVGWLEEELVEVKKQLQQEQVATRDLEESLKTARDAMQRNIKLTSALKGELEQPRQRMKYYSSKGRETRGDETGLGRLEKISSPYIKNLKSTKAKVDKRLEASKNQVTGLEKDLEAARQSIKARKRDLASLKLEIDDEDERIRLLKAQLFETNRLIQLEKEKEKLEAEQMEIQAALVGARASSSPDLGELMQREAQVDASLSQVEEKMVATVLDGMRHAEYRVRFESSKTGRQTGVNYVLVEDLEKEFEDLVVEKGGVRRYYCNKWKEEKVLHDDGNIFVLEFKGC